MSRRLEVELAALVAQLDGCNDSASVEAALHALRADLDSAAGAAQSPLTHDACMQLRLALATACKAARERMGGPDAWAPCAAVFGECLSALVHLSSQDVGPAEAATSKASVTMSPVVHVEPERAAVTALPWAGVTVGLAVLEAVSNCPLSSTSPPTVHTRDNRHNLHCSKVVRFVRTLMLCFVRRGVTLGPMASAHPQPQTLLPQLRPLAQMVTQTTRRVSQVQPLRPARQRPCRLCERR